MHNTAELARLAHDNFWIVVSFAYAQPALSEVMQKQFRGEWRPLHKNFFQRAEVGADRALRELASHLRALDDIAKLSDIFMKTERPALGVVVQGDNTKTDLHFRDFTNKIMHSKGFEWHLANEDPSIIVRSHEPDRWKYAEINLTRLIGMMGSIAF